MSPVVYTVGHSSRTAEELLTLLREAAIEVLVDVRRYPASRRNPQHNRGALERTLPAASIRYVWHGEVLGGRRRQEVPTEHSRNNGWTVPSFRYYADAMATPDFQAAAAQLESLARACPTAIMCAERVWWQCHRRLIADYLTVRGCSVIHLLDPARRQPHHLTEFARVENGQLIYPSLL